MTCRASTPALSMTARLAVLATALLGACGGSANVGPASVAPTPTPPPPNFVLIVTDDLDVLTTAALPKIGELMASEGLTFTRAYVAQSLCAPSRASILTGEYSHNHGVVDNHPPLGGFPLFRPHEGSTIATWLQDAGYRTSMVGKYMNEYPLHAGDGYIPVGWDDWYGHMSALEDGRYFNYWVNDNGTVMRHGAAQEDYSVDLEAAHAVEFIQESAGRPEPIFLYIAPEAPHAPANYVARHGSEFRYAQAPRVPSFDEADMSDKPEILRRIPPFTDAQIDATDKLQQWRLRCMRAVEDMVGAVLQALSETGRLESSYVFFTSDNGLLMGQHRLVDLKSTYFEEAVRVPLMIRGPGVPVGQVGQLVLNIDLAPTLLELAGVPVPDSVDGRSLAPFLRGESPASWRTDVLLENNGGRGLRTPDWLFADLDSTEVQLYDMQRDPYQLQSLHDQVDPSFFAPFRARIRTLRACHGASCRE
jgi:N-acetylglucosamine-6-sulfatase